MWHDVMDFDLVPLFSGMIFQQTTHGIEGITNSHIDIFMGMILMRFATDYQLFPRYRNIDAYMKQIALMMVFMVRFNDHTATHDVVMNLVKLFCLLPDVGFHLLG